MMETMIQANETQQNIFPNEELYNLLQSAYSIDDKDELKCQIKNNTTKDRLGFKGGTVAKYVTNYIMSECDRERAREPCKLCKGGGKADLT